MHLQFDTLANGNSSQTGTRTIGMIKYCRIIPEHIYTLNYKKGKKKWKIWHHEYINVTHNTAKNNKPLVTSVSQIIYERAGQKQNDSNYI